MASIGAKIKKRSWIGFEKGRLCEMKSIKKILARKRKIWFCMIEIACFFCIAGCESLFWFLVDTTPIFLDFQHMSDDTKALFAKDRTGMTKAEVLAELVSAEYAINKQNTSYNKCFAINTKGGIDCWRPRVLRGDWLTMRVNFPSNTSDVVVRFISGNKFYTSEVRNHFHIDGDLFFREKWGYPLLIQVGEWQLSNLDDCCNLIYPRDVQKGINIESYAILKEMDERDLAAFFLRESCCWSIRREQVGVNMAPFGCINYDELLLEFDETGTVVRQKHVTYGIADG